VRIGVVNEEGLLSKTYYISDHHFHHANIIEYESRPFENLSDMDTFMVSAWNATVSPEDTVIYGGDLALGSIRGYKSRITPLVASLNGKKILVKGNHERSQKTSRAIGFDETHSYYFKDGVLVVHDLMKQWDRLCQQINEADYVLYGHVHRKLLDAPVVAGKKKFINICVEHLDYIPRTLEELKEIRDKQLFTKDWEHFYEVIGGGNE